MLFMVLYHWLNYFYGPTGDVYKYLRFLTPSFIFITGFLISYVHFAKYGTGSVKLSNRLLVRGAKLLAVFLTLNVAVSFLEPSSFVRDMAAGRSVSGDLDAIFVTGNLADAAGKIAAFGILVPIAYVLMLSALLSLVCPYLRSVFHAVSALGLVGMIILSMHHAESLNLELVTIGLIGVVLGYTSRQAIEKMVHRAWVILIGYSAYLVAITIWNVSLYVQMAGAIITTALLYVVGVRTGEYERVTSLVVLLGKYSLFGYIAQIAILQFLSLALRHAGHGPIILLGSLLAGIVFTIASVKAVDRGRALSKTVDRLYRVVFA